MTPDDHELGEAVLRQLCEGAVIGGIRFGAIPQLLIDHRRPRPPVRGQVYVNLGSRWTIFESRRSVLPATEDQLPDRRSEEECRLLYEIRERTIVRAELGCHMPHLILTLNDGVVFFLSGSDAQYESWQAGVAFGDSPGEWLV